MNWFSIIIFIFSSMSLAIADSLFDFKSSNDQIIKEYLNLQSKFSREMCSKAEDHKYFDLVREYRGEGFYVPILGESDLDVETIIYHLPYIKKKSAWISSNIEYLKKKKNFKKAFASLQEIQGNVNKLLDFKFKHHQEESRNKKELIKILSREEMGQLLKNFNRFINEAPFMLAYNFPVNHFEMRKKYEDHKGSEKIKDKKIANNVYFQRRILEDGAQDPNKKNSDRMFRAVLNTISLRLNKDHDLLPENLRYDLKYLVRRARRYLRLGKNQHIERLTEWKNRTEKNYEFYSSLIDFKGLNRTQSAKSRMMLKRLSQGRFNLKDYTLKQQAKVYDYWHGKSELMQALYSLETILFSEVGDLDGRDALDRKDVAQVVINRTTIPFFSSIDEKESFYPYVVKVVSNTEIQKSKWLNTLFKEGEFSFTYYFITGSVKIYCPDMSRRGKFLRRENLKIALNMLREPNWDFLATRYFSRASMLGRIDMTRVWSDYVPMPERPGLLARSQNRLKKLYKRSKFRYLYSFSDPGQREFNVVEMRNHVYSVQELSTGAKFFKHRNPHYFTYFRFKDSTRSGLK